MKLSRNQKYKIVTLLYIVAGVLACLYFKEGNTIKPRSESDINLFVILGFVIYLFVGSAVVTRKYFYRNRFDTTDENAASTELNSLGQIYSDRHKPIHLRVALSAMDLSKLERHKMCELPLYFANKPLRPGDQLDLFDQKDPTQAIQATVHKIDGVNKKVILKYQ